MSLRALLGPGVLLIALPLCAGGFETDPQGARAAGLAGACVASVNDATAVFCNPGALALIPKRKGAAVGVSASAFNHSFYQGLPPGAGAGTAAQQTTPRAMQPHLFAAIPLGANAVLGTGFYHPFRMNTEWTGPDQFAGRFVATSSKIEVYDLATTVAVHAGDRFGLGAGVIYRTSSMAAARHVQTDAQQEIGALTMTTDAKRSLGYTAGIFLRPAAALSLGGSYRSKTRTSVSGVGRLTQIKTGNQQFDDLITAAYPFGQDLLLNSTTELPAQTTFGIALTPGEALLLELDAERAAWKDVHDIVFAFPSDPRLDKTYTLGLHDSWTYRAGLRWRFATGPQLRLGYAFAKTPLPDWGVSAFFPDSDRTTVTAGLGLDWIDVAFGMTTYKQRIVTTSATDLNGNYRAKSWFAVMTVTK